MIDMSVLPITHLVRVWKARVDESFKCANFGRSIDDVSVLLGFVVSDVKPHICARCDSFFAQRGAHDRVPEICHAEND